MNNNKGMTFVFVSLLMFVILTLLSAVMSMGLNDMKVSKTVDEKLKAYYIAEAGIYYSGSIILDAVNASTEPASTETKNNPFTDYNKNHSFKLTVTKEGQNYRVISEGVYSNQKQKVEALISITGNSITYSQMKKIS